MDHNMIPATVPVLRISDVKSLIDFADECRAAVIARGEAPWVMPAEMIIPAYQTR